MNEDNDEEDAAADEQRDDNRQHSFSTCIAPAYQVGYTAGRTNTGSSVDYIRTLDALNEALTIKYL